jgi:mRNA interferase MazF
VRTGDIILIPFPFSELTNKKVRPAIVIAITKDKYKDIIVCAVSSLVPEKPNAYEIVIERSATNKLRSASVIKVDRIVTLKKDRIIARLGKLSLAELAAFKTKFKSLVEN